MNTVLKTISLAVLVGLNAMLVSVSAQAQSTSTVQAKQQVAPARAAKPAQPVTPQGSLSAKGAVSVSAACCQKSCSKESNFCGTGCSVVKSLSECAGENWNNISFECPANKGMVCKGSSCSCQ